MTRTIPSLALLALTGVLLAGCGSDAAQQVAETPEAIVGGLDTVAPQDLAELSGQDLADVVEAAGEYSCEPDGDTAWTCRSDAGGAGAISIVAGDAVELSSDGPIGADTADALADALGIDASEAAGAAGLRWP
jgi:hypothetical protein